MQTLDPFIFFSGASLTTYFVVCLLCGLHLTFGLFGPKQSSNIVLSRFLGIILLVLSCAAVFYILSATFARFDSWWRVGFALDYLALTLTACIGYFLYANNQPSLPYVIILSCPFLALLVVFIIKPSWEDILLEIAGLVLLSYYIFFSIAMRKREHSLDDLYSNPDSHSLRWVKEVTVLFAGWFAVFLSFYFTDLILWHDVAISLYMTCFVLFVTIKVSRFGTPVSRDSQEQIDKADWSEVNTLPESSKNLQSELLKLLDEEQIFLYPDLTVDYVVKKLGTKTKYFSAMLHNDMHTTFCGLINEYRVCKAKELLLSSDDKVANIALRCGFNSVQSFYRAFANIVGKKPVEWRNEQKKTSK